MKISTRAQRAATIHGATIKNATAMSKFFAWLSQIAPALLPHSSD
jgi:hypothetical protein